MNRKIRILFNTVLLALLAAIGLPSCRSQRAAASSSAKPTDEVSKPEETAVDTVMYDSRTVRVMYGVPNIIYNDTTRRKKDIDEHPILVKYGVPMSNF